MAESVFVGVLTAVSDREATFRVTQVYKGHPGASVTLGQSRRRALARSSDVGQRFIIVAVRYGNRLQAHRCGNSRMLPGNTAIPSELAAELGAPRAP